MKLKFNRPFKSIRQLADTELPIFTILTGINGSGKSQLLEAIETNSISIEGVPPNTPHAPRKIRRFDWNSLVSQDTGPFSPSQISSELNGMWGQIKQFKTNILQQIYTQFPALGIAFLENIELSEIRELKVDDLIKKGLEAGQANIAWTWLQSVITQVETQATHQFINADPMVRRPLIDTISTSLKKPLIDLESDEFYEAIPKNWQPIDLFQQSFGRIFTSYRQVENENKLRNQDKANGKSVNALSDDEFREKYGEPPWDFLNHIFEVAALDFRINEPYSYGDRPYEPTLTDTKRGSIVKFIDLSTGERILMSFALCLYHTSDTNLKPDFPQVLLFDEIDAPLHPSMTRSVLTTIQKTLVEKNNVSVILTTHSPTTIALAEESSIYVMKKYDDPRLQKTTKDTALGILTVDVPTISVKYENRRQVFVESKYDVQYYSALFLLSKVKIHPDVSLSFISAGVNGNSNCDQVISIVTQIRGAGNTTTFGIIDWDTKNHSTDAIFAIGEDERYSIENFVLDPVLVGLLSMRELFIPVSEFGFQKNTSYMDLRRLDIGCLQKIADKVVSLVSPSLASEEMKDATEFIYANGEKINVPRWFAFAQGHKLEVALKSAIPKLNKFRNEPDLKMEIISKVLPDFPNLIPNSILSLMRKIQEASIQ